MKQTGKTADWKTGGSMQEELGLRPEFSEMDIQGLLLEYQKNHNPDIKWELVLRMIGMVRTIAMQVWGTYNSFAQLDDIISEGILVLLNAIDKFDPSKEVKFETYVSKRLRGMVVDLARSQDWLPRQVRQKAIRLNRTTEELSIALGRSPTSQEMADYMGISLEEYGTLLSDTAVSGLISFEALLDSCSRVSNGLTTSEKTEERPEELYEEQELHQVLKDGINALRDKEKLVLSLYYEKELSMKEIAQVLNVSAPRVSQIHSRAIQNLRQHMKQYIQG